MGNTPSEPSQPAGPKLTCPLCGKALISAKVGTYGMYDAWYYGCPDECALVADEAESREA